MNYIRAAQDEMNSLFAKQYAKFNKLGRLEKKAWILHNIIPYFPTWYEYELDDDGGRFVALNDEDLTTKIGQKFRSIKKQPAARRRFAIPVHDDAVEREQPAMPKLGPAMRSSNRHHVSASLSVSPATDMNDTEVEPVIVEEKEKRTEATAVAAPPTQETDVEEEDTDDGEVDKEGDPGEKLHPQDFVSILRNAMGPQESWHRRKY